MYAVGSKKDVSFHDVQAGSKIVDLASYDRTQVLVAPDVFVVSWTVLQSQNKVMFQVRGRAR